MKWNNPRAILHADASARLALCVSLQVAKGSGEWPRATSAMRLTPSNRISPRVSTNKQHWEGPAGNTARGTSSSANSFFPAAKSAGRNRRKRCCSASARALTKPRRRSPDGIAIASSAAARERRSALPDPRHESLHFTPVLLVFLAKLLDHQPLFQHRFSLPLDREQQEPERGAQLAVFQRKPQRRQQQARVDRMPHPGVRPAAHQRVPFLQRDGAAPIAADVQPRPNRESQARDLQQIAQVLYPSAVRHEPVSERAAPQARREEQIERRRQHEHVDDQIRASHASHGPFVAESARYPHRDHQQPRQSGGCVHSASTRPEGSSSPKMRPSAISSSSSPWKMESNRGAFGSAWSRARTASRVATGRSRVGSPVCRAIAASASPAAGTFSSASTHRVTVAGGSTRLIGP